MFYSYTPKGVCSRQIEFEIDNGILKNVRFTGGCPGNLKALSALVEGMPYEEVLKRLSGIQCGFRETSCSDQLTKAIEEAVAERS
ncbi:MAG: TIGR03905 family TSCPD domain-containing protein [Merdibacter sp.]